jgi:HK97 family phage portal protein
MGFITDVLISKKAIEAPQNPLVPAIAEVAKQSGEGVNPLGTTDFLRTFATVEWVYSCIDQIQKAISQLPIKIYIDEEDSKKDISDSPVFEVFKHPDPYKTPIEFWEYSVGYKELTGELFWYLGRNSENDIPKFIIPLRSDRISIVPSEDKYIKGYIYQISEKRIPFQQWEIFYSRYFNPIDDYRGLSPIKAASNKITLDLNAGNWGIDFFKNGTRASGIFSAPTNIDDKQWNRIQKQFNEKYSGSGNSYKVIFLENDMKFQQVSLPPKDVEFIQLGKITKGVILSVLKVPPLLVMDLSDSSVLQNTEIQWKIFWEGIKSRVVRFAEEINTELMPMFGVDGAYLEFDLSEIEALQENLTKKRELYDQGWLKGAITPNEYRVDVLGKEPLKDSTMNSTYLPFNVMPAGQDTETPKKMLELKEKQILENKKQDEIKWKTFIRRTRPIERKFEPVLIKLFKQVEKEVLDNWNNQKNLDQYRIKGIDFSIDAIFDEEKWIEKFKKEGLPYIAEAVEAGGVGVLADLISDIEFDLTDPFVKDTIKRRLEFYSVEVNGTTRKEIVGAITDGLKENETIEQIADRLKHKFDLAEQLRAPKIARTEVSASFNAGNVEGMRMSGEVDEHRWLTSMDDDVRDSHRDLQGIKVKVGEPFPGYNDGTDSAYPSSINERCTTVPVSRE